MKSNLEFKVCLKSAKNLYLSHRFFCKIRQIHSFFNVLGRIYRFFAEIDDLLDDRYVGLLTDGSNGAYGYSGVEPGRKTKKAVCQALAEFIY